MKYPNRRVGVHLRITKTLEDLFHQAERLSLSALQFFFLSEKDKDFYDCRESECLAVRKIQTEKQLLSFVHGNYWINLADVRRTEHPLLERDIRQALQLGINTVVAHPGSIKGAASKKEALDHIVRVLQHVFTRYPDITILLENVAHQGGSIGGSIDDLAYIGAKIPSRQLGFCLDTSHAYAWGYDILSESTRNDFIEMVEQLIGWQRVNLIHLNDTAESCGSRIDIHSVIGQGVLGWETLVCFANSVRLQEIPIITEMPEMTEQELEHIVMQMQMRLE